MTDQNRDESFDLAINPDSMELRLWKHVQGDARFARYAPWDELGAALQTIAERDAKIAQLESEFEFMRGVARKAVKALDGVTEWREKCHEYDKENGHPLREFSNIEETWELLETFANSESYNLTEGIESI